MKIIAVITEPGGFTHWLEVRKKLECLKGDRAKAFNKVALKVSKYTC
jgi:hypothetical protein